MCMDLPLGFLFCSIDLYFCLCASTILSCCFLLLSSNVHWRRSSCLSQLFFATLCLFYFIFFPSLNPLSFSLPIQSLWVIPVHQQWAPCLMHRTWAEDLFPYDNIHVSMLFSQIITTLPSPTECKRLFYTSVSLLLSHQDSMVLAQRQKYRSMEQNREPRDKSTHIWIPYLWQRRQEYTMD